jgi:hypothetical protein
MRQKRVRSNTPAWPIRSGSDQQADAESRMGAVGFRKLSARIPAFY